MKYFFPALMALVILAGISLVATPYVAEMLFPAQKTTLRTATPQQVSAALASWLGVESGRVKEAQGTSQMSAQGKTSWFTFTVDRQPVEHFIRANRMRQQDLTPEILQRVFVAQTPSADWWQPASLERQTCFISTDEGQELGLIYDAEQQKGFLVARTRAKAGSF
ncbi:hypothetical protein [Thiothrix nivea]|uniref:Uncharacterized protein n=1 Tax=Thiothrix nivea (strain ATCC 35100 / DSM 5205 / JP2) TaxID=870187 RepID=A0A656HHG2_THINJ|nr:hypothetical protein [Thiothrix nivea]EIJ34916.1 hypothetical protein Thini_2362 [Thiothrix nivea DSM 5205]